MSPALLSDFESDLAFSGQIPPNLYQTGPSRDIHEDHLRQVKEFRELNSDLNHYFFDDFDTDEYMASVWGKHPIKGIYDRSLFGQMKADIFRYCILFERGGFYIDINKSVWTPLSSLITKSSTGLISFERSNSLIFPTGAAQSRLLFPEKTVLQWCFGFAPKHPILGLAIKKILENEHLFRGKNFGSPLEAVVAFTGPGVFTVAVREFVELSDTSGLVQIEPQFKNFGQTRLNQSARAFRVKHYGEWSDAPILR